MALLRNANPKNVSGGYERLFSNKELGLLFSKTQSGVISSGNELERIIIDSVQNVKNLDEFIQYKKMPKGIFLAKKEQIKLSRKLSISGAEPDFLVFKRDKKDQICHIIELKDGHVFDTKKANAEMQNMKNFVKQNTQNINYKIITHFCAFNQNSQQVIWEGFKKKILFKEAMTGRELCNLLEIDYDKIVKIRKEYGNQNVEYFLSELVKIDLVRQHLKKLLNS